ncbi:hypothetical protein GDO81_008862 [Engystomops pustulosus]|uniref:Transmembrane protein n=1 Tax=Engystomops pustulosus TaxID=76066 RepID=A0AAV7CI92_ENGPU|nr:hypothetical protein GDO81_008862 [Engystomops pustulosus]
MYEYFILEKKKNTKNWYQSVNSYKNIPDPCHVPGAVASLIAFIFNFYCTEISRRAAPSFHIFWGFFFFFFSRAWIWQVVTAASCPTKDERIGIEHKSRQGE